MGECICILGMHRSGTSCLTGIIQRLGVELGNVFTENPYNKWGNRENFDVMTLNDEVLAYNGGAWDKPVEVNKWTKDHEQRRYDIVEAIHSNTAEFWGFKDPRTLLTLPFWVEASISPAFIGTFRHPWRVAVSLNARNHMPINEGLQLWYEYNLRLLQLWEDNPFPLVNFDLPEYEYFNLLNKSILDVLGEKYCEKMHYAQEFFTENLRSQIAIDINTIALDDKLVQMYQRLQACSYN